jgi:AraC-like DNA-binding protein
MKLFELARAMIVAMPLGIFTTIMALLCTISAMKVRELKADFKRVAFLYLLCATFASVLFIAYYYYPDFFSRTDFVYCGAVVFTIVLFHRLFYFAIEIKKHFNRLHYIVPALVVSVLIASKLLFSDYRTSQQYNPAFIIILIFSVFYTGLSLFELHRFYVRQSITYRTTETINHFGVIVFVLETLMFAIVFGLFPLIGGQHPGLFVSLLLMTFILSALANNIPLVYGIIRYFTLNDSNRSLFDIIQLKKTASKQQFDTIFAKKEKRIYRKYSQKHRVTGELIEIDQTVFERYFRNHKPYLNPHLTLSDLTGPFGYNRTYLSKFINRVYGMNFNRYINSCRLREMDRLLAAPGHRHKYPEALYAQAGFSSYRNYMNAKEKLHKNTVITTINP